MLKNQQACFSEMTSLNCKLAYYTEPFWKKQENYK